MFVEEDRREGALDISSGHPALSRQPRVFSAQAAAELMHERLGDGCEWHWRYTIVNDTPQHFSFSVTFGPDGRVKELKPV
jgi:hypothetical protein